MKKIIVVFLVMSFQMSLVTAIYGKVIERIVAIVDDDLILLSEFQEALRSAKVSDSPASRERLLNDMIEKRLLLNEAKKYRTTASGKTRKNEIENSVIIRNYIYRRIKALIHIPYSEIEHYYQMNRDLYGDREIIDVRDTIEELLVKKELKIKLREHIEELRKKAYVRIQLNEGN